MGNCRCNPKNWITETVKTYYKRWYGITFSKVLSTSAPFPPTKTQLSLKPNDWIAELPSSLISLLASSFNLSINYQNHSVFFLTTIINCITKNNMDRLSIGLYMSMQSASINLMILVHTPKIPKHYHIVSWMTILVKFCHESWFNVKMKCDSLCSWVVVGGNQHNGSILNGLQKLHQRFNICKTGITCQLFNMINGFLY